MTLVFCSPWQSLLNHFLPGLLKLQLWVPQALLVLEQVLTSMQKMMLGQFGRKGFLKTVSQRSS